MINASSSPVAIVTGAASGLGRAYALRLAEDGFDLALFDIDDASESARAVERAGQHARTWQCDVADGASVDECVIDVASRRGPLTVVVNNAGVYPSSPSVENVTSDLWEEVMSVNLTGAFNVTRSAAPYLRRSAQGRVINIGSSICWSGLSATPYMASKMGVVGLTRSLAAELGEHGVTVNCISPGFVTTPGTDIERFAQMREYILDHQAIRRIAGPGDVAGVVAFLASKEAAFVTGQTILVDGGFAMH